MPFSKIKPCQPRKLPAPGRQQSAKAAEATAGQTIAKVILLPGELVNIVAKPG